MRINGKKGNTGTWVKTGMTIELWDLEEAIPKPYRMNLEVVFEDDYLAVINKPPGIPVSGNSFRTIENTLSENLSPSPLPDALKWPRPTHRLDSLTSGLLIIAKTAKARIGLGKMFEEKAISKTYQAIVMGNTPDSGKLETPIDNKPSITNYLTIERVRSLKNDWLCLLKLQPLTGRTHQIRIHSADMGHPILGDKLYGKEENVLKGKGLFLAATELKFDHPIKSEPLHFSIPVPGNFSTRLKNEQRRWNNYHSNE